MNQEIIELFKKLGWLVDSCEASKGCHTINIEDIDCVGEVLLINDSVIDGLTVN